MHAYRPRVIDGYLVFTRVTVTYTGTRPPYPGYRHGSVAYKLHYDSQYDDLYWM